MLVHSGIFFFIAIFLFWWDDLTFTQYPKQDMKTFRLLVSIQATYTLITAIWPLVHIESFMEVTGYKTDVWLVKTVGALLIPVAITLYTHLFLATDERPAIVLGGLTALAFICIDFYYALNDVISDIYLADGVVEIVFLLAWLYVALSRRRADHERLPQRRGGAKGR